MMMGILACLLFGLLAAWITRSMQLKVNANSLKSTLVIGILGGLAGLAGIIVGWGGLRDFNLFNVFLSILITAGLMLAWSGLKSGRHGGYKAPELAEEG